VQNRPNSAGVASNIQELWAMTQEVKTSKQRATVGRFDVSEAFFHFLLFSMLFLISSYFNTVLFRAPELPEGL